MKITHLRQMTKDSRKKEIESIPYTSEDMIGYKSSDFESINKTMTITPIE